MVHLTYSIAFISAVMLTGCVHARQSNCSAPPRASGEIEQTVHAFFDALRNDDEVAFRRLTTASFYSFDGGKRFAGTELVNIVRNAHSRGVQFNWSVGPLETKLRCQVAWSSWENVGSAGIPSDLRPIRWLESAVLVRQDGGWRIDFFHSQRAAEK